MKLTDWLKGNPLFIVIILVVVIIVIWIWRPIADSAEVEVLRNENTNLQSEFDRLEIDYDQMVEKVDSLNKVIKSGDIKWEKDEKELDNINNKDVPRTRDDVISWGVPEQLEYWENKRDYSEGREK